MHTLSQYLEWAEIPCENPPALSVSHIAVDSRLVRQNTLYCALAGERTDGHQFLHAAAEKGAIAALVDRRYRGPSEGLELIFVDDVLASLQAMAKGRIEASAAPVIAVTGSVGKTSSKEFLRSLLSVRWRVAATPGNANSQIGLPLTVLNHLQDPEMWILEMGISEPGEMERLVAIAPPTIALISKVALVHAATLGDEASIAREKSMIWSHSQSKFAVGPIALRSLWEAHGCEGIGFDQDYTIVLESSDIRILERGILSPPLKLSLSGMHMYQNLLGCIATVRRLGLSWGEIQEGLRDISVISGRGKQRLVGPVTVIDDAYNACEASMVAAFQALPFDRRSWAILGDMRELGSYADAAHRAVADAAESLVDSVCYVGEGWKDLVAPGHYFCDKEAALNAICADLEFGDVLLLKGACSHSLWTLTDQLEHYWKRRQIDGALAH